MQKSIYNRKHWHALSHSLPTHPPQRVSRVPDYLFMYSIQSVLGLSQVRLTLLGSHINMADGHVSRNSYVITLFFLGILYNAGRLSFKDRFCFATAADLEFETYCQPGQAPTAYLISVPAWNNSHHDSKVYKVKGYSSSRVSRYPNSSSTFQISRLIISEDISENPGPSKNKLICPECSRTIAENHRSLTCSICDLTYHIKGGNATPKDFKLIQRIVPMIWKCPICLHDISFDLNELPFASLSKGTFNSVVRTDPLYNEFSQCHSDSDHLQEIAQEINK